MAEDELHDVPTQPIGPTLSEQVDVHLARDNSPIDVNQFTMQSATHGDLAWIDGVWHGDTVLTTMIGDLVEREQSIPTVSSGPWIAAASTPAWVAWFTAKTADLEDLGIHDAVWSTAPEIPGHIVDVPPGALA